MDLSSVIRKIGHSLVEIRVRALKSIMCKLDHSLISIADIVQEKMLFVYLLEWFNFPEVPMQEEVLELLLSLAKHPGAAQMLRDVGAVDFLTKLSPNVEPRLRAVIDGTMDQLFQLPDLFPSQAIAFVQGSRTKAQTDEEHLSVGYFHKDEPSQAEVPPHKIAVHESVRCLKFSVFPWLTLTNTDRHILSSNESSLRSSSPNLVRTTCELLCDVIMQDFPAEIFLQWPSIVKSLLSLLRLSSTKGEAGFLHLQALSCLRQLCVGLRRRLSFHQDPSFYSTKQDPASQNSSFSVSQDLRPQRSQASSPATECSPRPSVVGRTGQRARGDGQDGDMAGNGAGPQHRVGRASQSPVADASHLSLPDAGADDVLELQLQQLTLAQFAVAALEHATPLLRTEGPHVFRRTLELLCDAVLLLGDSVCELVWDDHSLPGMELREKLQGCLELLADILSYHASSSLDTPRGSLLHHRTAYAGVAVLTIKLLQTVLPVEKATDNIPENMTEALFHLCLDLSFGGSFSSIQEAAVAYLEQVNSDGHDVYRRVTRAALWMESTCIFLKEAQAKGEKNWLELLELADRAIDGLPFHQHLPVVKECVDMCSHLWKFDQPSPILRTQSQKLLLKLLAHPLAPVRTETYQCTLDLLKDCLGIQSSSRLEEVACGGVNFLLHHRVLYEISAFGLQDSTEKVSAAAKDALLFLLKGRLMMTASTWDRLNEALHPVTPILQAYASTEESLGKCVLLWISGGTSQLRDVPRPSTAELQSALRLLFTKQPAVRKAAAQQILPLLTSMGDGGLARPELEERAMTTLLPNLFCVRNTLDVSLDYSGKSVLKVESVEKLFSILCSDTVDAPLRRSAAEQLAVVLQDTRMHPVLKGLGITDKAIYFIVDSSNGNKSLDCLLEPSVCILRKLVFADPPLRRSLVRRSSLLLALLRASLALKANNSSGSEAAALMALLLFDEVAEIETSLDKGKTDFAPASFSLPLLLTRRFHLPFKAATHHAVSPFRCVLLPSSDLLTLAPARQALQVAWNTAWHSGTDSLLEELSRPSSTSSKFHSDLKLSEGQLLTLRVLHPPGALRDCLHAITTAAGHVSVTSALSRLSLYLLIDRVALPHSATYSCRETLRSLNWQTAVSRFLQVKLVSVEDRRLLVAVVALLNVYFRQDGAELVSTAEDRDLHWILELLLNQESESLFSLLFSTESKASARGSGESDELMNHVSRRLQRELSCFFNLLLHRLKTTTDRLCLALAGPFRSQLAMRLLQSLRVSDAPRFYGLPSLERTLQAIVTLTARPAWSSHCLDSEPAALCSKYLSGLLEVISSFYVEWGGNSLSFMGKGVTKNALISLLHLSHEMMAQNKGEDFISQWSLGNEATTEDTSASGLAWLIPLWVDRDQEVRFASMGLGASLSLVPCGCQALCASCQNISGGLWGTLLNILLDRQESSVVRREAAFILQNLLVMPMPADAEEAKDSQWQQPCVHDEVTGLSLVGLPALQALLYHCRYFQHVALCASNCYQGRRLFHSQPYANASSGLFPQENSLLDFEDSLLLWRSAPAAATDNQRRPSSSLSTSSTMSRGSMLHTPKGLSPLNVTEDTPASRLMAQGQSDTDTSDSAFSPASRHSELPAASLVAVVTPGLMAAHCGLLSNLVAILPDFTLTALRHNQLLEALAGLVHASPVEKCVTQLKTPNIQPGEGEVIKSQITTLLQFLSSFSRLLHSCVSVSLDLIGRLGSLKQLVATLVSVLTLNPEGLDVGTRDAVCECWADLFTLLATLVRRDASAVYPSISAALGRRWRLFAGSLSVCVDERTGDHPAHTAALQFLAVVFTEETKSRGVGVPPSAATTTAAAASSSSSSSSSSLRETVNSPAAGRLCEMLLQSFESKTLQDPSRRVAARALMTLLACSPTAQTHAAKAGVIDTRVEQMKQSHSQLQLESVRPNKASRSKKEEGHLKEVKLHAEILRSALYCNDECKAVATEARLTPAVHALWPWLLLDDAAMEAALELLCVYTASSAAACSTLCGSGPCAAAGPKGGSSLMHLVMKLASGVAADNSTVQMLAFSLLANLAISRECRGVLQKNHFLQAFPSVPAPKVGGVKTTTGGSGGLLGLWLRLLVNLSFAEDGQQNILKVPQVLEVLADLAQHRRLALLTLHNLCFCPANKPHVIANDKAMKVLISCLSSKEAEMRCMGASALWALLHNNQRAKTTLKCPAVRLQIEEAHRLSKKDADSKQDASTSYLLKCLDNLSQLLNT